MSVTNPVVVAENAWTERGAVTELSTQLAREVMLVGTFDELCDVLDGLGDDLMASEPIVVLDAGIPGVCRLDTVRLAAARAPRARIIQWTGNRQVPIHTGALLDGAWASLSKSQPLATLVRVIERVATGRLWCEPDQAQWFADFLACLRSHHLGTRDSVWSWADLDTLDVPRIDRLHGELLAVAQGEPFGPQDGWFRDVLAVVRRFWLPPHLRQLRTALSLYSVRAEAAAAIGLVDQSGKVNAGTVSGYCGRLAARLMPARYMGGGNDGSHALVRAIIEHHMGCELPNESHDLTAEAFGVKENRTRRGRPST